MELADAVKLQFIGLSSIMDVGAAISRPAVKACVFCIGYGELRIVTWHGRLIAAPTFPIGSARQTAIYFSRNLFYNGENRHKEASLC